MDEDIYICECMVEECDNTHIPTKEYEELRQSVFYNKSSCFITIKSHTHESCEIFQETEHLYLRGYEK
jgi:hypothetical protein